uniref:Glucosidase II beta subunit N-terminal domain-containing protein n=1 Tax=Leptocylindrus danicus TaxID=163516 RepID=A0A7S2LV52_9STRA|mmetsp:Transcript_9897/g.14821  ORF Transcript_9897/g.14821 Transcript_9897/m.14821 type:complete len:244 (+) Transcript_9897:61-792(+)
MSLTGMKNSRSLTNRRGGTKKNHYQYNNDNIDGNDNDTSSHSQADLFSSQHSGIRQQPSPSKYRRRYIQGYKHNQANLCISIIFGVVILVSFFELLYLYGTFADVPRYVQNAAAAGNVQSKKKLDKKQHLRAPKRYFPVQITSKVESSGVNDAGGYITINHTCNDGTKITYHGFSDDGTSIGTLIINDGYCDCPDGSDETSTDACSHILVQQYLFRCDQNVKAIFPSRIGDGVQDCIDGTDEE